MIDGSTDLIVQYSVPLSIKFVGNHKFDFSEAEFKEYDSQLKFETQLKYEFFHLKLHSMFQDFSCRSIKTGFWRIWDAAQIH